MAVHPYRDVAIAAGFNTVQAKRLEGYDSQSIAIEAALGALAQAGLRANEVDGVFGQFASEIVYALGMAPAYISGAQGGIPELLDAAAAIALGQCSVALLAGGGAGAYTERTSVAPWTRIANEFVIPYGMFTALEFALVARRHMETYGTTAEQMATAAATVRNNGSRNPGAVFFGKGPFTVDDILASRMVADPFHLLECAMTAEGGSALILTRAERAVDLATKPTYILGGGVDRHGPSYMHPPAWDHVGRPGTPPLGEVGRRAAKHAFTTAGLTPDDVDVAELYDPFSFEIIRQLEAHGFCGPGEGGAFVEDGNIAPAGRLPITTDGGTMSFSHGGGTVQKLQRVIRAVEQVQGNCAANQVADVDVALVSAGGSGALYNDVLLLGKVRP